MPNPALAAATYSALNAHPYVAAAGLAASTAYKYRSLAAPAANLAFKAGKAMGRAYAKRKRSNVSSWTRRTQKSKRRRHTRKRWSNRRVAIGRFLPFKKTVRMRYCETITLNPTANPTGSVEKLIYPQLVCDPLNHGDSNHQPYQYDEAMTYYDRATVIGAKVRARVVPYTNESTPIYWGMTTDHSTDPKLDLTGMDHDELQMMHGVPRMSLVQSTHYRGRQGYDKGFNRVIKYKPTKFFHDKNMMQASEAVPTYGKYSCGKLFNETGALTDEPIIKLFCSGPNIAELDAAEIYFQVTIDFIVVLTHKEVVAPEPDA